MNILKKIVFLGLFQMLAMHVFAVHIKGGWMYYEYLGEGTNGGSNYKMVVKVYRDCAAPELGQNDPEIFISIFDNFTNVRVRDVNAKKTGMYGLEKKSFNECISPKPKVCYVIMEYTGFVELPKNLAGYTAAFQRCCRLNGIVNVVQPSNELGNSYTISIPGNVNNAEYFKNSSPQFSQNDTIAVCYNSPFTLDYSATDLNNDSLVYSFTSALNGASNGNPNPTEAATPPYYPVKYNPGFSESDPFGTNCLIDTKTGIIKGISPAITGEYVVGVTVMEYRQGVFIATTRKELHVNVAACSIVAATLPPNILQCNSFSVQLENLSASPAIFSYNWDFGVPNTNTDISTLATPTFNYPDTGVFTAKLIINKGLDCSDSATTQIRVFPGFVPAFSYNGSCILNPFSFTNTSTSRYGNINAQRWNFGDPTTRADTSLLPSLNYVYSALGTYTVSMRVANDKGCVDTVVKQIKVLDKPLLELGFSDTLICSIDSLQLRANGFGEFTWTPTLRMSNPNTATPTVFPIDTTTYTVTLRDRGCIDSARVTINTLDSVTVDAGPDSTICRTDGVVLQPITQALNFEWLPAATLSNAFVKTPIATPTAGSTTYTVIARLGKCTATDRLTLQTLPYPTANAGPDTTLCIADTVLLNGTTNGSNYAWLPANLVDNANALATAAYPTQTTAFVLRVTDTAGCIKPRYDTVLVNISPKIRVFAGNDTSIVIGQQLQLNALTNATSFSWSPSTGISNSTIVNPIISIANNMMAYGENAVKYVLTVSTFKGCEASDDIIIRVFNTPPTIFIPNAFTPNGDGKNELYRPILVGIKQLIFFRVYNRYGKLIFETTEVGKGWDGKVNGQIQNSTAFVYTCRAVDFNNRTINSSGSFVLVR